MDTNRPQAIDRIAYYGRVSTPRQKLEHQREAVVRFCEANGIQLRKDLMFEDRVRRHRAAQEGENFKRLMRLVERRDIDWIVIATFDRWGIQDKDDIFVLRKTLRKFDVQLWSVADELNITGADDAAFVNVAMKAVWATGYVSQMAEKNIFKMVTMAEQGWAASGNAPYGLDLVCYPLHDLNRPLFRVVRMRYKQPHLYKIIRDGKEEISQSMPPRDKKATGYRLEPSIEKDRLKAVNLMFELYDQGMGFAAISENLWKQGYKHYDRPFGYHGVEVILSNTAYIGMPGWGKVGVGQYLHAIGKMPTKIKRKSTDTLTIKKAEADVIYPLQPLFEPVVPVDLFNRVKEKLANRVHVNESFGKRRTRDRTQHPLNGKVICPDCSTPDKPSPMVFGSSMPREGKGKRTRYYICSTYRKSIRTKCKANSVRWDDLDRATEELLSIVADRIDAVTSGDLSGLQKDEWLQQTELGRIFARIYAYFETGQEDMDPDTDEEVAEYVRERLARGEDPKAEDGESFFNHDTQKWEKSPNVLEMAFSFYESRFAEATEELRAEAADIDRQLETIADEIARGIASQTVRNRLNKKMVDLEARKAEIGPKLVPLTAQANAILDQLRTIRQTIEATDTLERAQLFDTFLKAVVPDFELRKGKGRQRGHRIAFTFVPRETAKKIMPEPMKISVSHTGRGSWTRPGRSWPGTSSS